MLGGLEMYHACETKKIVEFKIISFRNNTLRYSLPGSIRLYGLKINEVGFIIFIEVLVFPEAR